MAATGGWLMLQRPSPPQAVGAGGGSRGAHGSKGSSPATATGAARNGNGVHKKDASVANSTEELRKKLIDAELDNVALNQRLAEALAKLVRFPPCTFVRTRILMCLGQTIPPRARVPVASREAIFRFLVQRQLICSHPIGGEGRRATRERTGRYRPHGFCGVRDSRASAYQP